MEINFSWNENISVSNFKLQNFPIPWKFDKSISLFFFIGEFYKNFTLITTNKYIYIKEKRYQSVNYIK